MKNRKILLLALLSMVLVFSLILPVSVMAQSTSDFGDAPAPYPTLLANNGARHPVGSIYLGATIDAELDGQPNSTATGDDNNNINDEDGVVFTTPLVKGQSANVTVTASAAGYLDAWVDFNDDGDWADAGEQIFTSQALSAGANNLTFTVPNSPTDDQTFARFRFSSTGGLSYVGLAADGEVEDYQVTLNEVLSLECLVSPNPTTVGHVTNFIAAASGGVPPYSWLWTINGTPVAISQNTAYIFATAGTYTVCVTVTDSLGNKRQCCKNVTVIEPDLPDLWISEIKPVQVVWEPDINGDGRIDLVAGKSTMVRVYVGMEDYAQLPKDTPIEVQLTFDGANYIEVKSIKELDENKWVDFYPAPPTTIGDQVILAKIDPADKIKESNEDNNTGSPVGVTIKDTSGLYLYYIPVDRPITYFGYGPIDMGEFSETVSQSGKFIEATYPVAKEEFTNEKSDEKYYANPVPFLGMLEDALGLWAWGELSTNTLADKVIGIVPDDYFKYHLQPDWQGKSYPYVSAVLVENGSWTTTAHEIGHTYRLHWSKILGGPGEEYETNPPVGNPVSGFWVNERKEIHPFDEDTWEGGICFMGAGDAEHSFSFDVLGRIPIWVDKEDYEALFKKFLIDKTDPAVLLISGLIFDNGEIELKRMYMMKEGIIDQDIVPGDYSIEITDLNGEILTSIPFGAFFEAYTDPETNIERGVTGFAFVIPYPGDTSKIQIQHNGETLIEINPNTKLLHDAVDSIPDHGFINNPDQRRNALHNKIDAVERMIERGNLRPSMNKLERAIKDKLQKWLFDDYKVESPLQLSKVEVINLTQTIIDRLGNQSG